MLEIADGSKEDDKHGWSVVLEDVDGVFARACSGALLLCGPLGARDGAAKDWRCVLCELGVPREALLGFVADNVSTTFGADGGGGGAPPAFGSTRCVVSMRRFWKRELVGSTMCRHNTTPFASTSSRAGMKPVMGLRMTG